VTDVIFGDYNPGGKVPITVPRSVGQLPDYYYQKPSAKREYLGSTVQQLFSFGWGLSYSEFKYANLHVAPEEIGPEGKAKVSVDVSNTAHRPGDEVIQLYIRDEISSVTRPIKELRSSTGSRCNLEKAKPSSSLSVLTTFHFSIAICAG